MPIVASFPVFFACAYEYTPFRPGAHPPFFVILYICGSAGGFGNQLSAPEPVWADGAFTFDVGSPAADPAKVSNISTVADYDSDTGLFTFSLTTSYFFYQYDTGLGTMQVDIDGFTVTGTEVMDPETAVGAVTYQRQYQKSDSPKWYNVTNNGKQATCSFSPAPRHVGYTCRCAVSNGYGTVCTDSVQLLP